MWGETELCGFRGKGLQAHRHHRFCVETSHNTACRYRWATFNGRQLASACTVDFPKNPQSATGPSNGAIDLVMPRTSS